MDSRRIRAVLAVIGVMTTLGAVQASAQMDKLKSSTPQQRTDAPSPSGSAPSAGREKIEQKLEGAAGGSS